MHDFAGAGWDNVAWIGDRDLDLAAAPCPVLLWHGDEDSLAGPEMAHHLAERLPRASLPCGRATAISRRSSTQPT
jgi:pimeloyl-ACP methyl ester carboxylesterase